MIHRALAAMAPLTPALLLAWPSAAHACAHPTGEAPYVIHHEDHGDIGRHVVRFECDGEDLIVETEIEGEVRVLMIPFFKREGTYREVWRDDLLVAFDSRIVDNGESYQVTARAEDGRTVIKGRAGRVEAPPTIVSNHPWNHDVVERPLLFDTREGKLQEVEVELVGPDQLTGGGREVEAQKYQVTGDLERELWYDQDGTWLRSRFNYKGDAITVTRR